MKKAGIDLGSRFVKIAVYDGGEKTFTRYETVEFYRKYILRSKGIVSIDAEKLGLGSDFKITATGYGRNLMNFGNAEIISEIKAHFQGAINFSGEKDFLLIDIGGQDSKVILAKDGYIEDFVMNDKCAASTGRFAENACVVLGITLAELSEMRENPADLTSTCAVFCESEIISLMASGIETERIGAGINMSIAKRIAPMAKSFSADRLYASGGVAENKALAYFLSVILKREIIPVANPQFNGAEGCLNI